MLVLSRKLDEVIQIGDDIFVKVVRITPSVIRLGIVAPKDLPITRPTRPIGQIRREVKSLRRKC